MTWVVVEGEEEKVVVVEEEEEEKVVVRVLVEEEVVGVEEEVRVERFVVRGDSSRLQVRSRKVEKSDPSRLQSGMPDLKAPQ